MCLYVVNPDLYFISDASDLGWGAFLGDKKISGVWSQEDRSLHINLKELKVIFLGLQNFAEEVSKKKVVIYADNTTVLAYIRLQEGTHSFSLYEMAKDLLLWADQN